MGLRRIISKGESAENFGTIRWKFVDKGLRAPYSTGGGFQFQHGKLFIDPSEAMISTKRLETSIQEVSLAMSMMALAFSDAAEQEKTERRAFIQAKLQECRTERTYKTGFHYYSEDVSRFTLLGITKSGLLPVLVADVTAEGLTAHFAKGGAARMMYFLTDEEYEFLTTDHRPLTNFCCEEPDQVEHAGAIQTAG